MPSASTRRQPGTDPPREVTGWEGQSHWGPPPGGGASRHSQWQQSIPVTDCGGRDTFRASQEPANQQERRVKRGGRGGVRAAVPVPVAVPQHLQLTPEERVEYLCSPHSCVQHTAKRS